MREARRPFSSFFRRLLGGSDVEEERPTKEASNELPEPEEEPEEFWNPRQGAPPTELVRPMRPQFPVWKKDIPGLTDPFVDEEEWQDPWLRERRRTSRSSRDATYAEPDTRLQEEEQVPAPQQAPTAQNGGISPLSLVDGRNHQPRPQWSASSRTMEQHPERSENLDSVVDRLLRDKDFLLAEELKHKAEEINQLLVQAQRQKMKVELTVSELESRPGNHISWLDVKIFKEI